MVQAFVLCFIIVGGDDLGICIVFYNCRWRWSRHLYCVL